jgi:hypothetical protein
MDVLIKNLGERDFSLYAYVGTALIAAYGIHHIIQTWLLFRRCNLPMAGMEKGFIRARIALATNVWDFVGEAYAKVYGTIID